MELKQNTFLNSASRFYGRSTGRVQTQQNTSCHNQPHKLNRILESKLNSVKRSPELSVSLPELSKTLFTKAF
ncbi:hypothetical protein [Leptospira noguchii]|uniref:hypothetical protein n=1 Tax=Leptospira noguchii TaxID=28182 RepID=UPI0015EE7CDE|nr:hypothetical protein [Leptospira noguchii]UOG52978.1 hypothetical protein MAL09_01735 [Leptospira noguchii]